MIDARALITDRRTSCHTGPVHSVANPSPFDSSATAHCVELDYVRLFVWLLQNCDRFRVVRAESRVVKCDSVWQKILCGGGGEKPEIIVAAKKGKNAAVVATMNKSRQLEW